MALDVMRQDTLIASIDASLAIVAAHNWEHRTVVINNNTHREFMSSLQAGCVFRVRCWVGGGGGHQLFIANFSLGCLQ